MTTHSSVLAWRVPGTGEPGGLPSVGWHRVGHDWNDLAEAAATGTKDKEGCVEGRINDLPKIQPSLQNLKYVILHVKGEADGIKLAN